MADDNVDISGIMSNLNKHQKIAAIFFILAKVHSLVTAGLIFASHFLALPFLIFTASLLTTSIVLCVWDMKTKKSSKTNNDLELQNLQQLLQAGKVEQAQSYIKSTLAYMNNEK